MLLERAAENRTRLVRELEPYLHIELSASVGCVDIDALFFDNLTLSRGTRPMLQGRFDPHPPHVTLCGVRKHELHFSLPRVSLL